MSDVIKAMEIRDQLDRLQKEEDELTDVYRKRCADVRSRRERLRTLCKHAWGRPISANEEYREPLEASDFWQICVTCGERRRLKTNHRNEPEIPDDK